MTNITWNRLLLALGLAAVLNAAALAEDKQPATPPVPAQPKIQVDSATHVEVGEIKIKSSDDKYKLQTLAIDSEGRILALFAPPRGYGAPVKDAISEIQVLNADGKVINTWKIDFHASAINAGPDGTVYVGGDAKVASFDKTGKLLARIELPHFAEWLKDGTLQKEADAQIAQTKETYAKARKDITDRKTKIEDKKAEDRTDQDSRQLKQLEQLLKTYDQAEASFKPEMVLAQLTAGLRTINGIAVNEKEVFVVCHEAKGYTYGVWRMDRAFKNTKQIVSGIGGCCFQVDIQCCGKDIVLAENTKHSWAKYDREGKELGRFGKRGTEIEGDCFGGCCNPMNLRCTKADVYTAESEGIIKRYTVDGKYVGVVGIATIPDGCKNVAVAASPDGAKVYLCDQPGSRIVILGKKTEK